MTYFLSHPAGAVALAERNLILLAVSLMLIVAIPMFIILFTFARKYRAGNLKVEAKYSPNLSRNPWVTFALWAVPVTLIAVLAVINWQTTHALDPMQPITTADGAAPGVAPLTIQVVALPWKFLFIYPAQNIATINFIEFPVNTPLHLELTADAPMSSFWIPDLGSQIYAMPAMMTQMNLIANQTGDFGGMDTEINGVGFSGMKFVARSATQEDFDAWVAGVQGGVEQASTTYPALDLAAYNMLAAPSEYNAVAYYSSVSGDLFDGVVMKYMMPGGMEMIGSSTSAMETSTMEFMPGMQM